MCRGGHETNMINSNPGYCSACYVRHLRWRDRFKQGICQEPSCRTSFTTTRVDAKFCPNRSRQKAHRDAARMEKDGPAGAD